MRVVLLLATFASLWCSGCSFMFVAGGVDLDKFENRTQVRARFGEPRESGLDGDFPYDEYRYHRNVAERGLAQGYGMMAGLTLGASEVVALPIVVCRQTYGLVAGRRIRFLYDAEGNVRDFSVSGSVEHQIARDEITSNPTPEPLEPIQEELTTEQEPSHTTR